MREEITKILTTWHAEVTGETNVNFVPDMQVENLINELEAFVTKAQSEVLQAVREKGPGSYTQEETNRMTDPEIWRQMHIENNQNELWHTAINTVAKERGLS